MLVLNKLLEAIKQLYPIPSVSFIDIGARGGINRPWDQFPQKYLSYYGFDADDRECQRLKNQSNLNCKIFSAVLSDKESSETLYLTEEEGCSSIFKPNFELINRFYYSDMWRIKREVPLQTTTLKKIFDKNNIKPDYLKIDTQGAELKILKGAGEYLDNVLGLELEVEFMHMYENQPLFFEIDNFLRSKGFELFDLNRHWANRISMNKYHSNRGQIVFADAIYFRTKDSLYSFNSTSKDEQKNKLFKMVMIFSLYGYFDVALDYLNHPFSPFSKEELNLLEKTLKDLSAFPYWHKVFLNNRFAKSLGRFFLYLGNIFSLIMKTYGWGSDYNSFDGRYMYYENNPIAKHLKK